MIVEARNNFISGNYALAEPLLQQLILQGTRNPEIYQMLGTIFYDKGLFSKAIKTFQRALEIDPSYTDASVGLSIILNDLGKYEEGRQVFVDAQQVLEKKTSKSDPFINERLASKHEELGDLYFQYKRHSEALEQTLKALQLSSRKPELTMRLAEIYSQMGQNDRAVKELKGLVHDYPQLVTARLKLGLVLYNYNRIAEAVEQWENILVRDPHHPEALRYIKMAQAAGITSMEL